MRPECGLDIQQCERSQLANVHNGERSHRDRVVEGEAMQLGYHTITWGGVVGDATGVTSVKDLFYRRERLDGPTAIADIAAAGYDGDRDVRRQRRGLRRPARRAAGDSWPTPAWSWSASTPAATSSTPDLLDDELHRVSPSRRAGRASSAPATSSSAAAPAGRPAPRTRTTPPWAPPSTRSPTSPSSTASPPATTRT